MGSQLPSSKRGIAAQFSVHVYCGQTAGWMKTPHGTEVDLDPCHIVLDGDPAPAGMGHSSPPLFSAQLLWSRSPISAIDELFLHRSRKSVVGQTGATWLIRLNLCILRPTRVHNPNGISIGSAVFVLLAPECPYTLQWADTFRQNFRFSWRSGTPSWFPGPTQVLLAVTITATDDPMTHSSSNSRPTACITREAYV